MLRLSLGAVGSVYATSGSLNNHLDFLLALANLPPDSDYAIIEMGIGHIPTQLNRLSMTLHVRTIASSILPLRSTGSVQPDSLFSSIVALLAFSVVFTAIAAALFSLKESAGAKPKEA